MKRNFPISVAAVLLLSTLMPSCHKSDTLDYLNDPYGNFKALWETVDRHYCYFEEKHIDWDSIYSVYEPQAKNNLSSYNLFMLLSQMVNELKDGHVNLSSPFASSYYKGWWADYPQNFNERVVLQNYLEFNYDRLGAYTYGVVKNRNIGYIRVSSFISSLGEGNLDWILYRLGTANGLILDLRDNGGGELTACEQLASRFISTRTLAGYVSHKTGPGHNQFSEPKEFYYNPPEEPHLVWGKPVVVLTNRSTFSAANQLASFMKTRGGNIVLAGDTTGGGSGLPMSMSIPLGWTIRMSASPMLDSERRSNEWGVAPTPGHRVDAPDSEYALGRDMIIEHAINYLSEL